MNGHVQPHLQGQPTAGQPRGPYPAQQGAKQPGLQGLPTSQTLHSQYAPDERLYEPQMSLWSIHKPPNNRSWSTAEPRQQRVSAQDVQDRMTRFRREGENVADILMRIKPASALKAVDGLVQEQNEILWQYDPTLQYMIACIKLKEEIIRSWPNKGYKQIIRIELILKPEPRMMTNVPRGFINPRDTYQMKSSSTMAQDPYRPQGTTGQGPAQTQKNNPSQGPSNTQPQHANTQQQSYRPQPQGQSQGQNQGQNQGQGQPQGQGQGQFHGQAHPQAPGQAHGQNVGQQQGQAHGQPQGQVRGQPQGQGHGPGQGQGHAQGHGLGGMPPPPPPPPPPHGPPTHGPQAGGIPPPPPPFSGPPSGPPRQPPVVQPQVAQPQVIQPQQMPQQQQPRPMPGAFPPEQLVYPGGMKQAPPRAQPIEVLDPGVLKKQKLTPRSPRHEYRNEDSDTNSDDSFSSRSVEDGSYSYIERSRSRDRKESALRSRSKPRDRSRGRDSIAKSHKTKRSHRQTRSDEESPMRDEFNAARKSTSPQPPNGAAPSQNIFNIRIDNDNERDQRASSKGRDAHGRTRDSRRSASSSPVDIHKMPFRKQNKHGAEPMLRNDSNNGSDSELSYVSGSSSSFSNSNGSIFSKPDRARLSRTYPEASGQLPLRTPAILRPHDHGFQPSYPDYGNLTKMQYSRADDYPPQRLSSREAPYDDHIIPPTSSTWQRPIQPLRRHTEQQNPFQPSTRFAPQRSMSYAEPEHPAYNNYPPVQPTRGFIAEREHDPMELQDIADAMDYIQTRRQSMVGRRSSGRVPMGLGRAADMDEWDNHYLSRYERVHPAYTRYRV